MENPLENKVLLEKVGALLNKLTPTTKDDIINEFLSYKVSSEHPDVLMKVVNLIFEKAVEAPSFCPLYVELCKRQVDFELKENPRASKFRDELLYRAQKAFKKAFLEKEKSKKEQLFYAQLDGDDCKFRSRNFGIITLIGHLYRCSVLSSRLVQKYLFELQHHSHSVNGVPATPPYNEEFLQCAVLLLMYVGQMLVNSPNCNTKAYVNQTLDHLLGISADCSVKTKVVILDLMRLRSNLWIGAENTGKAMATLFKQLEEAEAEKVELSKKLEEVKQGRQQAEADKAEVVKQLDISKKMLTCSEVANEKLRGENSALLEECAAGAMSSICDQLQLEKVESEKNLLSANYEKALAEIQANSVQLHFANRQIRKLRDEVNKFNAQGTGKEEKEENEVSEDVWHKKDALLIKDQCDEFKDAFELLHGAISSSLCNGMMASDEKVLAENLSIAGKLAEKASSIRDGFMASTGTHVECIKDLLDDLLPCDDSAYSVTTENSDFEVIKE